MKVFVLAITLAVVFACNALAQSVVPVSGSLATDLDTAYYPVTVDAGAAVVSVTLVVNLTTPSPAGIFVEFWDTDGMAAFDGNPGLSPSYQTEVSSLTGQVSMAHVASFQGLRNFVVSVTTDGAGLGGATYSGTISSTAGTVSLGAPLFASGAGYHRPAPNYLLYVAEVAAGSRTASFTVNYGPTPRPMTFNFTAQTLLGGTFLLQDTTGAIPEDLATYANDGASAVTTVPHSGTASFLVTIQSGAPVNLVFFHVFTETSAPAAQGIVLIEGDTGGSGGGAGLCSLTANGVPSGAAAILLAGLAAAAALRRRKWSSGSAA